MITGFNTEAKYDGVTFHVQTEDRGEKAARIDTIIYRSGGAIVHKKQIHYNDILNCDCLEEAVREIMEDVHLKTINEVKKGLWTLGAECVPSESFREVVGKYLLDPGKMAGLN